MTTVTGDIAVDFSSASNQNPWVNSDFTALAGTLQIDSNTLRSAAGGIGFYRITGETWGNLITCRFEYWQNSTYDWIGCSITDSTTAEVDYEGYFFFLENTTPKLVKVTNGSYPQGGPDTSGIGTYAAITGLTQGDTFELELNQTTHAFTIRRNGTIIQTTGAANSVTDSTYTTNLIPGICSAGGDIGNGRIRSIAFSGVSSSSPVISSPTPSGTLGTSTTATIGGSTNHPTAGSNNAYCVVDSAANLTGVTETQIKLGQKASGTAAAASGNVAVTSGTFAISITGLTANTLYTYKIVQNDVDGDSNIISGTFTTAAATFTTTLNLVDTSNAAIANGYAVDWFEVAAWPTGTGSLTVRSYGSNITTISGGALVLSGPNSGSGVVFLKSHSDGTIVGIYNVTWA